MNFLSFFIVCGQNWRRLISTEGHTNSLDLWLDNWQRFRYWLGWCWMIGNFIPGPKVYMLFLNFFALGSVLIGCILKPKNIQPLQYREL